ncbi:hypothetical protein ACH4TV_03000 [Streptomyces sp. NPDC020898]|uniref:hypothetical protein n=1 Tax=Streptomyces sp. NPDC020898 TaxID=3365101 RepID=UPI0037A9A0DB
MTDTHKSAANTPDPDLPATERPGTDRPGTERPATERSATGLPGTEKPRTERSATERPGARTPAGASAPVPPPAAPGPARAGEDRHHGIALLPQDERDKLTLRLQHAVTGFVDGPRGSVEEADRVLEEVSARFAEAVTHSRRTLHASWQSAGGSDTGDNGDTERFRLALRDYRELTERLLRF